MNLANLLAEDVTVWGDGGGKVRRASLHPVRGQAAVAQFVIASTRFTSVDLSEVKWETAVIIRMKWATAVFRQFGL